MNNQPNEFYPLPQELQDIKLHSNGHAKDRFETRLARILGKSLNQAVSRFTEVQKRTLVLVFMLLVASYFVFVFSKGFQPSRNADEVDHTLPSAPAQQVIPPSNMQQRNGSAQPAFSDTTQLQTKP